MMRDSAMPAPTSARRPKGLLADTVKLTLLALVLGGLFGLLPVERASAQVAEPTHIRVTGKSFGATQHIDMSNNKSLILDLPTDVQEVIVSQPGVATTVLRTKRRAIVQTQAAGDTNIFFLDGGGRTIVVLDLSVKPPVSNVASALRDTFRRVLPRSNIQVESVELGDSRINRVVLSGTAASSDDVDKAVAIAAQFAGGPENVASVVTVSGSQQVMLKVTVAEVNRSLAKQFGINLSGSVDIGGLTTSLLSNRGTDIANSALSSGIGGTGNIGMKFDAGPVSIDATLRALEGRNGAKLLAEPTLTALSGQKAEFLAGGEFPIRTVDENGQAATIFKPFGVELAFTPTVRSNGVVGLVVDTSVSEVTSADGALNKRRASTTVELPPGTTLAIGGLIEERTRRQLNHLPGLGDVPILGALFRSSDFVRSQSELVILVTPYLARATHEEPVLPTDTTAMANDAEALFLGHIESVYAVGPAGTRGSYDGSVGFLLD